MPPISLVAMIESARLDGIITVMSPDAADSEEFWSLPPASNSARMLPMAVCNFNGPLSVLTRMVPAADWHFTPRADPT